MTQPREFNAETVEEAVQKASESLGLPASDLSYEVLDAGSEGFAVAPDASDEPGDEPDDEFLEGEPVVVPSEAEEEEDIATPPPSADLSEVYGESAEDEDVPAPKELLDEIRTMVTSLVDAM